jgi:hypothetical protein
MARYLDADGVSGEKRPRGRGIQQQWVSEGADMTDQKPNRLSRKVGQIGLAIVAALAVVIGLASPAYANFPHFKTASVSLANSSLAGARTAASNTSSSAQLPNLLYTWKEVGLGNPDLVYRLSTDVTVTFACMNDGGKYSSDYHKTTVTKQLQVKLASDKNGNITASVILDTGSVFPTGFSCPYGRTPVAISATFTHNKITDKTNGVTATDEDISVPLGP